MTVIRHVSARRRPVHAPPTSRGRSRARSDRFGSCGRPRSDPGSWPRFVLERGLNERATGRVRARVLCSASSVLRLCLLAVLTRPSSRAGEAASPQGARGGPASWEIRALARRSRKQRALACDDHPAKGPHRGRAVAT
jgi:hypothetical protein